MKPQFKAIADHALLVTFAEEISEEAHAHVVTLDKALANDTPAGVIESVPALVNLLVSFDPMRTDHLTVEAHVQSCLDGMVSQAIAGVQRTVQVASATGLSSEAVINAHLACDFQVLMYGFAPGYAYLSGVAEQIQVPRKRAPVRDVPAGSVIIAGPQCLVTTLTMPTGWSILGRSPTPIFTGDPNHPFLFDVGDKVTFERIDRPTFDRLNKDVVHG